MRSCFNDFIFFTSVEQLDVREVLEKHRRNFLYVNTSRITVRRSSIWDDALRAVKRTFDEKKHVRITFIGESAVDGGGPRREFFMLLMNAIRENNSHLDGHSSTRILRHNITALQEELYLCMGKMIALSIIHGGPGPSYFAECVVDYLFSGLKAVTARVTDIPDAIIQQHLQKVELAVIVTLHCFYISFLLILDSTIPSVMSRCRTSDIEVIIKYQNNTQLNWTKQRNKGFYTQHA